MSKFVGNLGMLVRGIRKEGEMEMQEMFEKQMKSLQDVSERDYDLSKSRRGLDVGRTEGAFDYPDSVVLWDAIEGNYGRRAQPSERPY